MFFFWLWDKRMRTVTLILLVINCNRPMWNFNKLLGVSGFSIVTCSSDDKNVIFHLKRRRKTAICPSCFKRIKTIYDQTPERRLKHGTILGKICTIFFRTRRFYCVYCKVVFVEETNIASKYQRATLKHKKEVVFNAVNNVL